LTKKEETSTLCSSNVVGLLPTDADTSAFDALAVRSSFTFTTDHHHHTFFVILSSFHHPPLSPQLHSGSGIKFHHFLVLVTAIIMDLIKSGQAGCVYMQQGGYCHASNGASYDFAELNDVL
jgi:hypothetical protein